MAIGERIHHFRLLRGFTQKYLGQQLGFSESQADVRIVQYEKARKLLMEHRAKLDELASYLYEKETITGDEFMTILNREAEA